MTTNEAPVSRMLYSAAEVAEQLSVGLTTAKALIRSGALRSVKIGRSRRVPADALRAYVELLDAEQNGGTPTARQSYRDPVDHSVYDQPIA